MSVLRDNTEQFVMVVDGEIPAFTVIGIDDNKAIKTVMLPFVVLSMLLIICASLIIYVPAQIVNIIYLLYMRCVWRDDE